MGQNQPISWQQAIQRVLSESDDPLNSADITDRILTSGLRAKTGATPVATVNAIISSSIKSKGDGSPYVRVGKGLFALKTRLVSGHGQSKTDAPVSTPSLPETDEPEPSESAGLIQAFGMYWERNAVHWQQTTQLLGRYDRKSTTVDFGAQTGVYLLFDGRNVVYAGRTELRQSGDALARRLFEHTEDRLKGRWDRFSWFGLRTVNDAGTLGPIPERYAPTQSALIATLEALLIEAFEPPQNRKRGDSLRDREYIQVEDPEVEARRARAFLMSKL